MSDRTENVHQGWIARLAKYSFLMLVASLGLPHVPMPLFGMDVLITDLLFLLTAGIWLLSVVCSQLRFVWHGFYWGLLAYLIAMLISAIFSVDPSTSFRRLLEEGYLICLAGLAVNVIGSRSDLKRSIIAWLAGTLIAVVIGLATVVLFYLQPNSWLLEYLTYHYGSVPVGDYPRITAGFISASMLCNFLNVSFVMVLIAANERWISRRIAIAFILTVVLAAAFTVSIGLGGLALAVGISLSYWPSLPRSVRRTAFALGCLISFLFLLQSFCALAPYPGANVFWTVPAVGVELLPSARVLVWADASRTFLSHPVTGIGLGKPVANVVFTNTDGSLSLLTDAHNSFLSVAAQNGIIGLAAFLFLVGLLLRRWIGELRTTSFTSILALVGLAFLCSFVYQGLTGSYEDARHLWVLIGIFVAAERISGDSI